MVNILVPGVPAMLCPPRGRGLAGEVAVLSDGYEIKVLWLSNDLDVTGDPMFGGTFYPYDLIGAQPRFGGRVDCGGGRYLVFGKKRIAAEFLAALAACVASA